MSDQPVMNTDRELWRETPGDYYAPSLHVTERGGIGMDVGGLVHVRPIRNWHALVQEVVDLRRSHEYADRDVDHLQGEVAMLRRILEQIASCKCTSGLKDCKCVTCLARSAIATVRKS